MEGTSQSPFTFQLFFVANMSMQIHAHKFPTIARITQNYIAIPGAIILVKRLFKSWHLCTDQRSSLKAATVLKAMYSQEWLWEGLMKWDQAICPVFCFSKFTVSVYLRTKIKNKQNSWSPNMELTVLQSHPQTILPGTDNDGGWTLPSAPHDSESQEMV